MCNLLLLFSKSKTLFELWSKEAGIWKIHKYDWGQPNKTLQEREQKMESRRIKHYALIYERIALSFNYINLRLYFPCFYGSAKNLFALFVADMIIFRSELSLIRYATVSAIYSDYSRWSHESSNVAEMSLTWAIFLKSFWPICKRLLTLKIWVIFIRWNKHLHF